MPDVPDRARLERNADLVIAATYERVVEAGIDSVWENVFDWEHLPWLHDQAFTSIEHRASGPWGWHADIGFRGGDSAEIELVVDRPAQSYVSRTVSGAGAPGEIWTRLQAVSPERTAIHVEFCVQPRKPEELAQIGAGLRAVYQGLWDQDEEMMQVREGAGASLTDEGESADEPVDLGAWSALEARLPLVARFGGHPFRVVRAGSEVVAHSVECPHWRGPLSECVVDDGIVTCPWHGYRFDVASGRSSDGRKFRLRRAPRVEIDRELDRVRLVRAVDT